MAVIWFLVSVVAAYLALVATLGVLTLIADSAWRIARALSNNRKR